MTASSSSPEDAELTNAGESSNVEEKERNEKGNREAKNHEMRKKKRGTLGQGLSRELKEIILGLD